MPRRGQIVSGDVELRRALREIPISVSKNLDPAIKDALEPMRKQASDNARRNRQPGKRPKGGHIDEGVATAKKEQRGRFHRVWWVGLRNRARSLGHLLELGTAPHWQPKRGVHHPGARPFPFMQPAFEAKKEETARTLGQKTWELIAAAAVAMGRHSR